MSMRMFARATTIALLASCKVPVDTGNPQDTDADSDSDSDTDADSDADSDSDADVDTGPDPIDGPLSCTPVSSNLTVSGSSETVQFEAWLDDGSGLVPADNVNWVIDGVGSLAPDGLYTSPPDFGGTARISAVRDERVATCVIEVTATGSRNESGNGSVPNAFESATPTANDSCAPTLLYPLANSAMPGSFAPPLIQWQGGGNMFALELASQFTTVTVYTDETEYQPPLDMWAGLTHYDPATVVEITLTSGNWSGSSFSGPVCTMSAPVSIEVTDDGIDGTIVYWAPPKTRSITFASGVPTSNELVDLPAGVFNCHGCHAVNLAKPKRMTYGPGMPGKTNLVDLDNPTAVLQTWGNGVGNMKDMGAPDPTGTYVVISGIQGGAKLVLFRQDTGAELATLTTTRAPTMANWSPDGTRIVYAGCDNGASVLGGANCDLYTQDWNPATETFSNERQIATHPANHTMYYPTFSPDSQWVAFNQAEQYATSDGPMTSNANPKAKVRLVAASGGTPIDLPNANGVGDLTNSWPRWAPAYGNYSWLAYSTKRDYGTQVSGTPQLWVTGIDLEQAANHDGDPSRPPTWIPGQLTTQGNHTPTWLPNKDRPTE